jgi:hypothetical protein
MGTAGAVLSGCSFNASVNSTPTVSKDALQKDISNRLTKAGAAPKSVVCNADLVGEVGKTTTCDVDLGGTNSIEPVVKVTAVNGTTVDYDMTPAVSQSQLEKSVLGLVGQGALGKVDSVSCESGLAGTTDAVAYCSVTSEGNTVRRLVEVTKIDGLELDYTVAPVLLKAEVESGLLDQLQQQLGQRPDAASCTDNLQGKTGATVDCVVTSGDQTQPFTLTVTAVQGSDINFHYQPKH